MIKVKAVLKKKTKSNVQPVFIRITKNRKSIYLSTGVKVKINKWDETNPYHPIKDDKYEYENNLIREKLNAVYEVLKNQFDISLQDVVKELKKQDHPEEETEEQQVLSTVLVDVLEKFIIHASHSYQRNTIKGYNDLKNKIAEFNNKIELAELDMNFYDEFKTYLIKEELSNSSIGKAFKNLKALLSWAKERGYPVNEEYKKFKVHRRPPTQIVYLTQKELKSVCELDLRECERLDRVRDMFIIQARTGLRISDLKRLSRNHIHEGVIRMEAYKNQNKTIIKITPWVEEKLAKYYYKLPKISEQKYNKYIKEVCQKAGLTNYVERIEDRTKRVINVPKWKLISSHTAVKTFITHCAEVGLSPKTVSYITGKTVKVILDHYYGINEEVVLKDMDKL